MTRRISRDYRKKALIERIDELRSLEAGWDTYDSPAITEEAIQAAKEFVSDFWAVPISDGGIGFEVTVGGFEVSIDFGPDGKVMSALLCFDRPEAPRA